MLSTSKPQNMMVNYTQPLTAVVFFGTSILKFFLFSILLTLAFLMWLWTISFQTGRLFAEWTQTEDPNTQEKPNVWQIAYKLGEIAIFPLLLLNKWVQKIVHDRLKIKFPSLSEVSPPRKCSELPFYKKMIEKMIENQE